MKSVQRTSCEGFVLYTFYFVTQTHFLELQCFLGYNKRKGGDEDGKILY